MVDVGNECLHGRGLRNHSLVDSLFLFKRLFGTTYYWLEPADKALEL